MQVPIVRDPNANCAVPMLLDKTTHMLNSQLQRLDLRTRRPPLHHLGQNHTCARRMRDAPRAMPTRNEDPSLPSPARLDASSQLLIRYARHEGPTARRHRAEALQAAMLANSSSRTSTQLEPFPDANSPVPAAAPLHHGRRRSSS
jgi:hypothetical protein